MNKTNSVRWLLAKKLLLAFLVGFGGVLIPQVLDLLDKIHNGVDVNFGWSVVYALVAGAFAAGIRAVFALSPLNFVPTDSLHSLGKEQPQSVTVVGREP